MDKLWLRSFSQVFLKPRFQRARSWTFVRSQHRTTTIRELEGANKGGSQERAYILLTVPILTFGLGTWQVQRRKWKLNLISKLEEKTRAEPVPFPEDLADLNELEYKKVNICGYFDHSREALIAPRPLLESDDKVGGGLIGGTSQIGAHVITPFYLPDRNMWILVNRGWVPRKNMNPKTRQRGQIEGEVSFTAVVRKSEKRPPFGQKKKKESNNRQWVYRDHEALAQVLNTEPVCLDADYASSVEGGPLGGQTRVTLRNEHLSYIFTWYSLSALTFFLWYRKYWLRK